MCRLRLVGCVPPRRGAATGYIYVPFRAAAHLPHLAGATHRVCLRPLGLTAAVCPDPPGHCICCGRREAHKATLLELSGSAPARCTMRSRWGMCLAAVAVAATGTVAVAALKEEADAPQMSEHMSAVTCPSEPEMAMARDGLNVSSCALLGTRKDVRARGSSFLKVEPLQPPSVGPVSTASLFLSVMIAVFEAVAALQLLLLPRGPLHRQPHRRWRSGLILVVVAVAGVLRLLRAGHLDRKEHSVHA